MSFSPLKTTKEEEESFERLEEMANHSSFLKLPLKKSIKGKKIKSKPNMKHIPQATELMDRLKLFMPTIRKANEDLLSIENTSDYVIEQIGEEFDDSPSKPGTIEMSFSVGEIPFALEEKSDTDHENDPSTGSENDSHTGSKDKLHLYKAKKILLD